MKRSVGGQSLVEGTLALLVFCALLFAVVDCGQVLVAHQALVERVREASRWGVVHPWDGTGEQIVSYVLYGQPDAHRSGSEGYLGLKPENVVVQYRTPAAARPDDELLKVSIVNYRYRFISPWFMEALVNPRPVSISLPVQFQERASP